MKAVNEYQIALADFSNNLIDLNKHFALRFFPIGFCSKYNFDDNVAAAVQTAKYADAAAIVAGSRGQMKNGFELNFPVISEVSDTAVNFQSSQKLKLVFT
jgi:hypothetical protein